LRRAGQASEIFPLAGIFETNGKDISSIISALLTVQNKKSNPHTKPFQDAIEK
jgi:hypothetical protein